ncbi:hypothetical protein C2S52_017464 [Perilla frutescens var. hirtella]|nr:hypothetical protein C2S52_017464 [Perilla frutescens var. hirtella]KAH6811246.1 hypothetical protein C2S51_025008 [Perilla frutescens var. frutescens]
MVLLARKSDIFQKLVKRVVHSTNESSRGLLYGDHEFSFQNTPIVHVRMHRPPSALRFIRMPHIPCIKPQADRHDDIDKRAEEFIAKFYEEIKLQT